MKKIKIRKQLQYMVEILLLWGYVTIVGFGIPIVRAGIMMSLKRIAFLTKRDYDPVIALLFSLTLLMLYTPYVIFSVGLQLSFGAVLSIQWIQPRLIGWVKKLRVSAYVSEKRLSGVLLCVAVQLGTLPILVNRFQMPSIFVVLTNLFAAPLVEVIMMVGLLIILLGLLRLVAIGRVIGYGAFFLGKVIEKIAEVFATVGTLQPWKILYFSHWQVVVYYILLIGILFLSVQWKRRCAVFLLCVFLVACSIPWASAQLQMTCIDVGQGDCIYMETPSGHHYLIDCGSSTVGDVGEYRILPYLKTRKVTTLTGIFLSHYDKDHISGLKQILETYQVSYLYLPWCETTDVEDAGVLALAEQHAVQVCYLKQGSIIWDRQVAIQCIHPAEGTNNADANAISMVLKVSYKEVDILLTGDLPIGEETTILDVAGPCEVLKVGHHGSSSSTGKELLQVVRPEIALISCDKNNRYGHPHKAVLDRLEEVGSEIYITAELGALTITSNGKNIVVTNFL